MTEEQGILVAEVKAAIHDIIRHLGSDGDGAPRRAAVSAGRALEWARRLDDSYRATRRDDAETA